VAGASRSRRCQVSLDPRKERPIEGRGEAQEGVGRLPVSQRARRRGRGGGPPPAGAPPRGVFRSRHHEGSPNDATARAWVMAEFVLLRLGG
jgi:hypothetical protein